MIETTLTTEKVVVNKIDAVVKGYFETALFQNLAQSVRQGHSAIPEIMQLRSADAAQGTVMKVALADAKAVFFVKEFEGQKQRKDLNFHQNAPLNDGVWVQLQFHDGETIEGLIFNSIHPLVEQGFFLVPTDPGSNNRLVYVLKHALANFRVLGLRPL